MFGVTLYHLRRAVFVGLPALIIPVAIQIPAVHAAPPLSGAIFTTDVNGSVVNGNTIYQLREDVYLDGGPGPNAPKTAAGLPDGDYYFQVTDPSGKKLLSTDPVKCRRITVADGIITSVANSAMGCEHDFGIDMDQGNHGAITVQLFPFDFTPNNGGVYKAWVTPVGDGTINGGGFVGDPNEVDNPCGNGCFHGFIPARSKTDNFKVGDKTPTFCLDVYKQIIDGKKGSVPGSNWKITITDPLGVSNDYFTDMDGFVDVCGLVAGTYTVTEALEDESGNPFDVIQVEVNGDPILPPSPSVEIQWTRGKDDPQVVEFTNAQCAKNCK